MIVRLLRTLSSVSIDKIIIVVGKYKEQIKTVIDTFFPNTTTNTIIEYVIQEEPLGTGHAIMCCKDELIKYPESQVLILSGDVPLITTETIHSLIQLQSSVNMLITELPDPTGYGRIVLNKNSQEFDKIVEQKDCTEEELQIFMVNGGIYCIKSVFLYNNFKFLKNNNNQSEYYLTDLIEIIKREEHVTIGLLHVNKDEIIGVNTLEQLISVNKIEI
jgi:bifunctional N-acetylglucosamine-1-phosphate-uridyltransferase/glucosamine-1-phosphate-acetyltransferase GlmU-like protein